MTTPPPDLSADSGFRALRRRLAEDFARFFSPPSLESDNQDDASSGCSYNEDDTP